VSDRLSLGDLGRAAKAIPTLTKVATGVISVLTAFASMAVGAWIWLDGFATDAEVAAQVAPLAKSEDVDRAVGKLRMDTDQERRARLRRDVAVFEHLVSLEAADIERDSRRKAEAAAFARTAYREAVARGAEPEDAANYARDQRPPWRH